MIEKVTGQILKGKSYGLAFVDSNYSDPSNVRMYKLVPPFPSAQLAASHVLTLPCRYLLRVDLLFMLKH
jgi:hypothetical protein